MTQSSDVILERMMALHPKVIDLTLDRMWRLLAALGNPQDRLPPVVHIAGTNGKGSTQAMIRAGLEGAGKSVHAYTSPHLARFHERIRLAGHVISEPALTDLLDRCYAANGDHPITYFEITTCAALLAFAETPADYLLLEVGLGGRLDATNVVDRPAVTVITPVDLDHQQFLGDTIAAIAGEKAGIIKQGVPCVVGPQHDTASDVIERVALRHRAPMMCYGQDWHVGTENGRLVFQDDSGLLDLPMPCLPGAHQVRNAGAALAVLRHLNMGDAAYEAAMTNAVWPARMQRLTTGPLVDKLQGKDVWLDGGHNPAAGQALADTLRDFPNRPTHIICGMINTKDITGFLKPICNIAQGLTAVTIPNEPNAIPATDIAQIATDLGIQAQTAPHIRAALDALAAAPDVGRVVICGSLYLAGHILRENTPPL
ncbi:MAG: folylpolyglutamate synthase/dihydrofolate synthase family protein [Pseudomonadota bacterium]